MTAAVVIAAAAVIAAGVAFTVMVMVVALNIGIEAKITGKLIFHCGVCIAPNTAVELDTSLLEGHLCAAADTAADQHICIQAGQNTGQSAVAAAAGIYNLGRNNSAIFHFVYLELLGVTEVLEDQTISVSDCDFHNA